MLLLLRFVRLYGHCGKPGLWQLHSFTTGTSSVTTAPTVVSINPPNSTTSTVPENVQIAAVISAQVDPLTVSQSAIALTPSVPGTVSLVSDQVTLQFVPNAESGAFDDVHD